MPETDKSNTKLHRLKVWFLKHIENFRDGVLSFLQDLDLSSFKSLKRLLFLFTVILVGSGVGVAIAGIKVPNLEKYIFDNVLFLVTYTLILVALSVFTFVTVFKYKYRISFWETLVFFLVFSFYFSWYNTENSSLTQFQFEYWDLNIFTIIIIILSVLFVGISLNASWPKKKRENNNTFLEDNPLSHDEQKEDTSYNHLISKIAPALFTDVYKSSFSIGVIGPWGTGKSSFLKAVKYAVCETSIKDLNTYYEIKIEKKPDTIFIEFSPFLNHNEEQVIHEFFTQLSNMLSERSGRLSNLISTYSEKLAKLSRHNSWFSLFNLAKSSRENLSAQELYTKIKDAIEELNLKIIVTVDDLDRLNAKEILQVLKLIRNTSNFPNTVFLVAMDKEYVMDALQEEEEYMKKRYLDKFFQLEVFIHLQKSDILKNNFITSITEALPISEENINLIKLKNELYSYHSAFNFFVKNQRDVKRVFNQFKLEFESLYDQKLNELELDIVDIYHLVLLKINFNSIYYNLSSPVETKKILEFEENKVFLKTKNQANNGYESVVFNDEIIDFFESSIFEKDENNVLECKINGKIFGNELGVLLIRLFADKYSINPVSLTHEDVYWNYFNSNFSSDGFSRRKFNDILSYNFKTNNYSIPNTDIDEDTLSNFFNNLKLIKPNRTNSANHLEASIYLVKRSHEVKKLFFQSTTQLLSEKISDALSFIDGLEDQKKLLEDFLIFNTQLDPLSKSRTFHYLIKQSKNAKVLLKENLITNEIINKYALDIFCEKIELNKSEWLENDYSIYYVYHDLKNINDLKIKLNPIFTNTILEDKNVFEVFLKQIIHPPQKGSREKHQYEISSVVKDIFGSHERYISVINKYLEIHNIKGWMELEQFHKLSEIRDYSPIYFGFTEFQSEKITETINDSMYSDNNRTEIYLIIEELNGNNGELFSHIVNDKELMKVLNRSIIVKPTGVWRNNTAPYELLDEDLYLLVEYQEKYLSKEFSEMIASLSKAVSRFYSNNFSYSYEQKYAEDLIKIDGKTVIRGYSKQP